MNVDTLIPVLVAVCQLRSLWHWQYVCRLHRQQQRHCHRQLLYREQQVWWQQGLHRQQEKALYQQDVWVCLNHMTSGCEQHRSIHNPNHYGPLIGLQVCCNCYRTKWPKVCNIVRNMNASPTQFLNTTQTYVSLTTTTTTTTTNTTRSLAAMLI
jgi:hypothetical protein